MPKAPPTILSPKNDYIFKTLFGDPNHTAPLAALLKSTLPLPPEEFTALKITDPNLNRRFKKDTVMAETVERLVELSASEKARRRAEAREKWLWDQASRMRHSRQEGLAEGEAKGRAAVARRLLVMKMPFADIAEATGLSGAEIKRLSAEKEIADSTKANAVKKPARQRKPAKRLPHA